MRTSTSQRIQELEGRGHWEGLSLHGLLDEAAADSGDALALADPPNRPELAGGAPRRLNYAELQATSAALAAELLARGVGADDTLIVQLPNIAELVVVYLAASRLGAIVSPLPVQYGPHELRHVAGATRPKALITLADFKGQALAAQAREALEAVEVWAFGEAGDLQLATGVEPAQRERLAAHAAAHPDDPNAVISVCWTSGTTGTPKGVPRSHNMWVATARCCIEAGDYRRGDALLNPFPLVNMAAVGAFLYPSLLMRASLVLHHPLDPAVYLRQLQEEAINFTIAPPALLNQLARAPEMWNQFDFSALRAVGSGSAPLAPWMIETFGRDYGKPVINFYGSNEGIALFCTPRVSDDAQVRATMFPRLGSGVGDFDGRAAELVRSRVVDPDSGGEIREPGAVGELEVGGATVFDGYLGMDTAGVFSEDGYFRTGDLVEICGEPPHFYRIAGRCKDIINRGGMKISPAEIDVLLEAMPGLAEAAVCAYPDEAMGERACACVVPAEGVEAPSLDEVTAWLGEQGLARFKLPERLEVFEALPRNPLNKVQRFKLQDEVANRRH